MIDVDIKVAQKSVLKLELKAVWYVTVLDRVLARSGLTKMKIKLYR